MILGSNGAGKTVRIAGWVIVFLTDPSTACSSSMANQWLGGVEQLWVLCSAAGTLASASTTGWGWEKPCVWTELHKCDLLMGLMLSAVAAAALVQQQLQMT
jgi:hypothetical protein